MIIGFIGSSSLRRVFCTIFEVEGRAFEAKAVRTSSAEAVSRSWSAMDVSRCSSDRQYV